MKNQSTSAVACFYETHEERMELLSSRFCKPIQSKHEWEHSSSSSNSTYFSSKFRSRFNSHQIVKQNENQINSCYHSNILCDVNNSEVSRNGTESVTFVGAATAASSDASQEVPRHANDKVPMGCMRSVWNANGGDDSNTSITNEKNENNPNISNVTEKETSQAPISHNCPLHCAMTKIFIFKLVSCISSFIFVYFLLLVCFGVFAFFFVWFVWFV